MQKQADKSLKSRKGVLAGAAVAMVAGVAAGWGWMQGTRSAAAPDHSGPAHATAADRTASPVFVGGRRVVVDPATGRITTAPTPLQAFEGALLNDMPGAFSRSAQGLVETPVAAPAGGFKVDLQGRFMSASRVSLDAEGRLKAECRSDCSLPHDHVRPAGAESAQVTSKEIPE